MLPQPGNDRAIAAIDWRGALRWALYLAAIAASVALLSRHAKSHLPFLEDDALISLRYAERLIAGKGLTWTDGERVEGYTNLLWVLATAALGAFRVDLIQAARTLGILGMGAAIVAVAAAHPPRDKRVLPAFFGGFVIAASGPIAVWTVGGLEQALVAPLLGWALVALYPLLDADTIRPRDFVLPGVLLALLALTRADGPLFTGAAVLGVIWARGLRRREIRALAPLALIPLAAVLGQLLFRRVYYSDWLPNTAYAKVAWTEARVLSGWEFIRDAARYATPLLAAGFAVTMGGILAPRTQIGRRTRLLLPAFVLWAAYVVAIGGGDTMPARRHTVPLVVLLALAVAEGAAALAGHVIARIGGALSLVGMLAGFHVLQQRDPRVTMAAGSRWEWDGEPVGNLLSAAFGKKAPLFAVDAAGCLPYFSRLPAIDMLGLNDKHVARKRAASFGKGKIGHELGDGKYVLSRKPDLILFCAPRNDGRPCWTGGFEIQSAAGFRTSYRLVTIEGTRPYTVRTQIWVRAEDGPLAVVREPSRVVVPGYFVASHRDVPARIEGGKLVALVSKKQKAGITALSLARGEWRLRVEAPGTAPVTVEIKSQRSGRAIARGAKEIGFVLGPATGEAIDVSIEVGGKSTVKVESLVFERVTR